MAHLPMLVIGLQAKFNVERKRQADIESGRVSMTGMVFTLCLVAFCLQYHAANTLLMVMSIFHRPRAVREAS